MKLVLGRTTDNGPIDQKAGTWIGGRNALVSKQFGAITNEPGFDRIISTLEGTNIGNIVLDSNLVAVFQINGANSEIYVVDLKQGTKRLITSNTEFAFSPSHPITGEYYRNSKGEIVITFTDDNMPPRILNIETNYGTAIDKLTRVYLKYSIPKLETYSISDTGGALKTGAHYIATAYINIDQANTEYSPALGPFYITDDIRSNIGPSYDGAEAGLLTSKSLTLNFSGVDTDYKYLLVALISKIDGVITAKQVKKVAIASSTLSVTVAGSEDEGVISIDDIIIGPDVYTKAKAMTQLGNQLIMANLSKEDALQFQLNALNIVVNYEQTIVDINATDDNNPKLKPVRGFMHNEVAALFIHLVKEDGTVTQGFHLPGRAKAVYSNSDFPEFNGLYEDQLVSVASGAHITRAIGIGGSSSKIFQFFDTADNPNANTNMGFWQNEETYPNSPEFGALAGTPIRHHKFPSLAHIKKKYYASDGTFGKNRLTRLNVKLSNVQLPAGYIGYFVSAAKRTLVNATILAQDIMLFAAQRMKYATTSELYWTTAGNWNTHTEGTDDNNIVTQYVRSHAFDLFINKPAISPNYVESELVIRNRDITVKYNHQNGTGGSILTSGGLYMGRFAPTPEIMSIEGVPLSDDNKKQDILVIDETKGNVEVTPTLAKSRFSGVQDFKYLPSGVSSALGIYMNLNAEEAAVMKLTNGEVFGFNNLLMKIYDGTHIRKFPQFMPDSGVGAAGVPEEVTHLYNIKQHKRDVYLNMFAQDLYLIHTDMKKPTSNLDQISVIGGDTIVSDMSFVTYGPQGPGDGSPSKGVRVARRHVVESVNFASYRYQNNDGRSYYYPKTAPFPFLMNLLKDYSYNMWTYNKDYTAVNDINSLTVNDPNDNVNLNTEFPYRIIRSKIDQAEEAGINNWRTFPIRDYYEMPKNRGEIVNIQGVGDLLVINQKYSLFRTRNKIKLATSEGEVTAGSGDIFQMPPEEIMPTKEGYAGCQHKSSCLLTKAGYTFIDAEQGKIFLLGGSLEEISLKGNSIYFFDAVKGVNDNPYTDTGFVVGWDSQYNRIIYGKTNGFTLSYSLDLQEGQWAFDHDYHPDSMFHTREGLYSFKNGVIFRHNSLTRIAQYYDDTIYPTFIVPVFNEPKEIEKYNINIKWRSEVRNRLGGIQKNETLTHLFIWNSYQATNLIQLANYIRPTLQSYNLRKTGGIWHFNRFRDLVINPAQPIQANLLPITGNLDLNKPFQYRRRFIDHYMIVNFMYDNQPVDGEQRNLYLYEVDTDIKPIER